MPLELPMRVEAVVARALDTWAADLSVAVSLGLVGSLHCVAMCGPIVLAYSMNPDARASGLRAHLTYNTGRVLTYTILGAAAGGLGGALSMAGRLAGLQQVGTVLAGAMMIVAGVALTGRGVDAPRWLSGSLIGGLTRRIARVFGVSSAASRFFLGLALGLLPCGLIYAALARAVATGSAWRGAVTMAAFGLTTATGLLAVGLGGVPFSRYTHRWKPRLAAGWVIVLGIVIVWRGLAATAMTAHEAHAPAASSAPSRHAH